MAGERIKGDSIFRVFVEKMSGSDRSDFVGNEGELFYDPTQREVFVSDGKTVGGVPLRTDLLDDLIDGIGDLDGDSLQKLIDVLNRLNDDKYDKVGGTIGGDVAVDPTGIGMTPVLTIDRTGVFVDREPTKSNQVTTKNYVDTTTIPFNISRLSSI